MSSQRSNRRTKSTSRTPTELPAIPSILEPAAGHFDWDRDFHQAQPFLVRIEEGSHALPDDLKEFFGGEPPPEAHWGEQVIEETIQETVEETVEEEEGPRQAWGYQNHHHPNSQISVTPKHQQYQHSRSPSPPPQTPPISSLAPAIDTAFNNTQNSQRSWKMASRPGKRFQGGTAHGRPPLNISDNTTFHGNPALDVSDSPDNNNRRKMDKRNAKPAHHQANEGCDDSGDMNVGLSERFGKGRRQPNRAYSNNQEEKSHFRPRHQGVLRFESEVVKSHSPWRCKPEIPTVDELYPDILEIPPNIVDGPWGSVEEYLGSHYELLREDATCSLRTCIDVIRENPDMDDVKEYGIYENVRLVGFTFSNMGVATKCSFSMNRVKKKIKWNQSKRLTAGTLVALSSDKFATQENIRLATVLARPISALELNPPEIDLLFKDDEVDIDASKTWMMVEARSSYYEAYKHTLSVLQKMTRDNFPLKEHIVHLDPDIQPPQYIQDYPFFDMKPVFPDAEDTPELRHCDIISDFPHVRETSMDPHQSNALQRMLTKSLAIVQGPPGTGKTFTSVLALKALIHNLKPGDPPIIVSCQTNHALDQILRKVLEFESSVVRVGGRTQDQEEIKKRTLYNLRRSSNIRVQGSSFAVHRAEMTKLTNSMIELLEPLSSDILTTEYLFKQGIITKGQFNAFKARADNWVSAVDHTKPAGAMTMWLDGYIDAIFEHEDFYQDVEEEDIEYERLIELEAEFHGGATETEFALNGNYHPLKRHFLVHPPVGVSAKEVQEHCTKSNIWEWDEQVRAAVYKHWEKLAYKKVSIEFRSLVARFSRAVKNLRLCTLEKDAYILEEAKVVGLTNTGLAKYRSLIAAINPRVVMIEEAAESLEGPIITALYPSVQHLILVGDHQQLRPHVGSKDLEEAPFNLAISMFERLVTNKIGFDRLSVQWRMRPEIRRLITPFYKDLTDHQSVMGRPHVPGMGSNDVYFYWHREHDSKDEGSGTSRLNHHEAEMIVKFVRHLYLNNVELEHITIMTFYTGQKNLIHRLLRKDDELKTQAYRVSVVTVDSYQGEENDIVILSLVRSNVENQIGFLSVANRVCVAMSRARHGFYIFGDGRMITNVNALWWEISGILNRSDPKRIGYGLPIVCKKHNRTKQINNVHDWEQLQGGCDLACNESLPCGHLCKLKCHSFGHDIAVCQERCMRKMVCCGVFCQRNCNEACFCRNCHTAEEELLFDQKQKQLKIMHGEDLFEGGLRHDSVVIRRPLNVAPHPRSAPGTAKQPVIQDVRKLEVNERAQNGRQIATVESQRSKKSAMLIEQPKEKRASPDNSGRVEAFKQEPIRQGSDRQDSRRTNGQIQSVGPSPQNTPNAVSADNTAPQPENGFKTKGKNQRGRRRGNNGVERNAQSATTFRFQHVKEEAPRRPPRTSSKGSEPYSGSGNIVFNKAAENVQLPVSYDASVYSNTATNTRLPSSVYGYINEDSPLTSQISERAPTPVVIEDLINVSPDVTPVMSPSIGSVAPSVAASGLSLLDDLLDDPLPDIELPSQFAGFNLLGSVTGKNADSINSGSAGETSTQHPPSVNSDTNGEEQNHEASDIDGSVVTVKANGNVEERAHVDNTNGHAAIDTMTDVNNSPEKSATLSNYIEKAGSEIGSPASVERKVNWFEGMTDL